MSSKSNGERRRRGRHANPPNATESTSTEHSLDVPPLDIEGLIKELDGLVAVALRDEFLDVIRSSSDEVCITTIFGPTCSEELLTFNRSLDPFDVTALAADVIVQRRSAEKLTGEDLPDIQFAFSPEKSTLFVALGLPPSLYTLSATPSGTALRAFRVLTCLVNLSNLVVYVEPSSCLSLGAVTLFKTIWAASQKTGSVRAEALKRLGVSCSSGRLGVPALLVIVDGQRIQIDAASSDSENAPEATRRGLLREVRHRLEDRFRRILIQGKVVNPSAAAKGLFSVQPNQEFIFIATNPSLAGDTTSRLLDMIGGATKSIDDILPTYRASTPDHNTLSSFIHRHIDRVFKPTAATVIPTAASATPLSEDARPSSPSGSATNEPTSSGPISLAHWVRAFLRVNAGLGSSQAMIRTMERYLCVSDTFSAALCQQVLEAALNVYSAGLPKHYGIGLHEERLNLAKEYLLSRARSSADKLNSLVAKLEANCKDAFSPDRRLCEQVSLFGNVCTLPLHSLPGESKRAEDEEAILPVSKHSFGVVSRAACNCGRMQVDRGDPFNSREANYDFYQEIEGDCCSKLLHIALQPMKNLEQKSAIPKRMTTSSGANSSLSGSAETSVSESAPVPVEPPCQEAASSGFSAWSLVSLGSFSTYSFSRGLAEHLPALIPGSRWLLPIGIDSEGQPVALPLTEIKGSATKAGFPAALAPVLHAGVEFECPKGHRFLLETPDKIMTSGGGSGGGKQQQQQQLQSTRRTAASNSPALCSAPISLFMQCCQCPAKAPMMGQLARLYVLVPPGGPGSVGVSLNARIQVSVKYIFSPAPESIALTPNNIWVLRFPFVYTSATSKNAETGLDEEIPILPTDKADYANFALLPGWLQLQSST